MGREARTRVAIRALIVLLLALVVRSAAGQTSPAQPPRAPLLIGAPVVDRCTDRVDTKPPGGELVEITGSSCLGSHAGQPAVSSTPSRPLALFDDRHLYASFFSRHDPHRILVTRYDGNACTPAARVDPRARDDASHDAPSVYVDGLGYVYVTYHGAALGLDGPAIRRTTRPHDVTSWLPEEPTRMWNGAESMGVPLEDGGILLVGSNITGRIDAIDPGGAYRWPAARQVIGQDSSAAGSACGSPGNRFTKAVFEEGWPTAAGGRVLLATWGWGGSYSPNARPRSLCPDIRTYKQDSHQVFFAWSDDSGATWRNRADTRRVAAPLCTTPQACTSGGIVHNDPAFRVTATRQRTYRAIWGHDDGTVYIAFEGSDWCERGEPCSQQNVRHPGALRMLRFRVGGPVEEFIVDRAPHVHTAAIRKSGSTIWIWSNNLEQKAAYEYRSDDEGRTWTGRPILRNAYRIHGLPRVPCLDATSLLITSHGDDRRVFVYRRTF